MTLRIMIGGRLVTQAQLDAITPVVNQRMQREISKAKFEPACMEAMAAAGCPLVDVDTLARQAHCGMHPVLWDLMRGLAPDGEAGIISAEHVRRWIGLVPPEEVNLAIDGKLLPLRQFTNRVIEMHEAGEDNAYEAYLRVYGDSHPREVGESAMHWIRRCAEQDFECGPQEGAVYQDIYDEVTVGAEPRTYTVRTFVSVGVTMEGVVANSLAAAVKQACDYSPYSGVLDSAKIKVEAPNGGVVTSVEWDDVEGVTHACVDLVGENGDVQSVFTDKNGIPLVIVNDRAMTPAEIMSDRGAAARRLMNGLSGDSDDSAQWMNAIEVSHGKEVVCDLVRLQSAILDGRILDLSGPSGACRAWEMRSVLEMCGVVDLLRHVALDGERFPAAKPAKPAKSMAP